MKYIVLILLLLASCKAPTVVIKCPHKDDVIVSYSEAYEFELPSPIYLNGEIIDEYYSTMPCITKNKFGEWVNCNK